MMTLKDPSLPTLESAWEIAATMIAPIVPQQGMATCRKMFYLGAAAFVTNQEAAAKYFDTEEDFEAYMISQCKLAMSEGEVS